MNSKDKATDYGDMLESMISAKKSNEEQKRKQNTEVFEMNRLAKLNVLRPFITILSQAKQKFPRSSIFNLECHHEMPHFYIDGDTRIIIDHKKDEDQFTLRRISNGRRHYSNEVIAASPNAEDLIPRLMELLLICVTK